MSAISDLLMASRNAHLTYQQNIPHKSGQGGTLTTAVGNPAMAREALQIASDMRVQAEQQDPTHADPGWSLDPIPSVKLMAFYAKELAK